MKKVLIYYSEEIKNCKMYLHPECKEHQIISKTVLTWILSEKPSLFNGKIA